MQFRISFFTLSFICFTTLNTALEVWVPEQYMVAEMSPTHVLCNVTGLNSTATFTWTAALNKSFVQHSQTLDIVETTLSHEDNYTCHVLTNGGVNVFATMELLVAYLPSWDTVALTKYAGAVGSSGFLECRVLCFPNAIFTWQFGGSDLVPNGRILIEYNGTTSTVMFTTVQALDHGLYTCTAANFAGSSSFDIQFLEPGLPDSPQECMVYNVTSYTVILHCVPGYQGGASIRFEVTKGISGAGDATVEEATEVEVMWLDDGQAELHVLGLYPSTNYTLHVYQTNTYGRSFTSVSVNVSTQPGDWPDESSSNVPGWVWIVSALGIGLLYFVIVVLVICVRDYREERQRKKESNLGVTDVNSYGVRNSPFSSNATSSTSSDHHLRRNDTTSSSWVPFRRKKPIDLGPAMYNLAHQSTVSNVAEPVYSSAAYGQSDAANAQQLPSISANLRRQAEAQRLRAGQSFIAGYGELQQTPALASYVPTVTVIGTMPPIGRHRTVHNNERQSSQHRDSWFDNENEDNAVNENAYELMQYAANAPDSRQLNDSRTFTNNNNNHMNTSANGSTMLHDTSLQMYDSLRLELADNAYNSLPHNVDNNLQTAGFVSEYSDNRPHAVDNDMQTNIQAYDNAAYDQAEPNWECDSQCIEYRKLIGVGHMGDVWKAKVNGLPSHRGKILAAVKVLRDSANVEQLAFFLHELNAMKSLPQHPHLIQLLGCCTIEGPCCIVMEYAQHGTLRDCLRQLRANSMSNNSTKDNYLSTISSLRDILVFGLQIISALHFTSARKLHPKHLTLGTVLMSDPRTCKLHGFGTVHQVQRYRLHIKNTTGRQAIRWLSPESLRRSVVNGKTDVWTLGVLLWELVTLGAIPYANLKTDTVIEHVTTGGCLPQPAACSSALYAVMTDCWQQTGKRRPSLEMLAEQVTAMLDDEEVNVDISQLAESMTDYDSFLQPPSSELF